MQSTLLQYIQQQTTIITPNQRLANSLSTDYAINCPETVWETPKITPIQNWLQDLFSSIDSQVALIDDNLALTIWENIIEHSQAGQALLNTEQTAIYAQQAWSLLNQWQLHMDGSQLYLSQDSQTFQDWKQSYHAYLQQREFIDSSQITQYLTKNLSQLHLPERILLYGFLEYTPEQSNLFEQLNCHDCQIIHHRSSTKNTQQHRLEFESSSVEITTMAHWAKQQIMANPQQSIACVVPDLTSKRAELVRLFKKVFYPDKLLSQQPNNPYYNISGGQTLSQHGLIHDGLLLLQFVTASLEINQVSRLLRSPYLANAQPQQFTRLSLDKALRDRGIQKLSLADLIHFLDSNTNNEDLFNILTELLTLKPLHQQTYSANQWAELFNHMLISVGWPGDAELNSIEYQLVQQWQALLQRFARLAFIDETFTLQQALQQLQKLTRQTIFQPQSQTTPINVLGSLEAAGIDFDQMWIMGVDDKKWPIAANPNPFIPMSLQHAKQLPHSSSLRELDFYNKLQQQLISNSRQVYISHTKQDGDISIACSPLSQNIPLITTEQLALKTDISIEQTLYDSRQLTNIPHDFAPMVTENEQIKGGTAIFKQQIACPFSSFAKFRLGAENIKQPELSISALDKGIILHAVMEKIWQQIQSHRQLLNYNENSLKQLIHRTCKKIIYRHHQRNQLNSAFLLMEQQRLEAVILRWLEQEKTRPPFTVIATEQKQQITIKALSLSIQIDRIDQLDNGQLIVIDYKTGKTSIANWFDETPDDPQLPIYMVFSEQNISGIMYAQINASEMKYLGVIDKNSLFTELKQIDELNFEFSAESWQQQKSFWFATLNNVAENFLAGDASVTPKYDKLTCNYCELSSLCRIHEREL